MNFYVYMILTNINGRNISYVGYTSDIDKRLKLHNSSKGAKFTKGKKWKLIYTKKFCSKILAMKYEYLLKKNKKKRSLIKLKANI